MDTFAALAVPARRKIIELLASEGVLAASDIYRRFALTAPTVSQHLKVLQVAKLVTVERVAQRRLYRINKKKLAELERWTHAVTAQWDKKFGALDAILEEQGSQQDKQR